jgi:hypothetical protein
LNHQTALFQRSASKLARTQRRFGQHALHDGRFADMRVTLDGGGALVLLG